MNKNEICNKDPHTHSLQFWGLECASMTLWSHDLRICWHECLAPHSFPLREATATARPPIPVRNAAHAGRIAGLRHQLLENLLIQCNVSIPFLFHFDCESCHRNAHAITLLRQLWTCEDLYFFSSTVVSGTFALSTNLWKPVDFRFWLPWHQWSQHKDWPSERVFGQYLRPYVASDVFDHIACSSHWLLCGASSCRSPNICRDTTPEQFSAAVPFALSASTVVCKKGDIRWSGCCSCSTLAGPNLLWICWIPQFVIVTVVWTRFWSGRFVRPCLHPLSDSIISRHQLIPPQWPLPVKSFISACQIAQKIVTSKGHHNPHRRVTIKDFLPPSKQFCGVSLLTPVWFHALKTTLKMPKTWFPYSLRQGRGKRN